MKYMRHIKITNKHIELAEKMSKSMGTLNNSITKGQGNIVGAEYLDIILDNTYDYDLIYKNKKIDVKSKKVTTPPKSYYECSIAALNTKQKCDLYIFTRITKDLSKGWILGYLDKENYLNIRIRFSTGPAHHRRMKPIKSEYTIATFIALHCKSDQDVSDLCGKVNQSTKMPVLKNQFRVKNTNFIFKNRNI